ncbi:MAG: hypothetical protein J6K43_01035 [Lachnospiraceae bacterium]|nr:hypothetical protein [Lachnospiraceae bacterium]
MGYCYAPIIDALTDDRQHIIMRGRRYTAPPLTSTCFVVCQSYRKIISESNIDIDLSKDAVLVCAWNKERFVDALLNIGKNVGNSFEYHKINHMAIYVYPIGLTIVYNGNHSFLSGILKGEGTIQANQTYDLVPTYDYMYFDGIYFRNKMNDEKLYKVRRFEIGALYEIGRILAENGIR